MSFTWRRRPVAGYAVVLLGLILVGAIYAMVTGSADLSAATTPTASPTDIAKGEQIFNQTCASCHGLQAVGTAVGPSLIGVGSAAVYFQTSTGRMPAKAPDAENDRKPVVFTAQQIHAIAAYIASLGGGPGIPSAAQVSTAGANTALGQSLFITDCAQCHNFDGAGGAPAQCGDPAHVLSSVSVGPTRPGRPAGQRMR